MQDEGRARDRPSRQDRDVRRPRAASGRPQSGRARRLSRAAGAPGRRARRDGLREARAADEGAGAR